MNYLKNLRYLALLAIFALIALAPAAKADAQVRFGVAIGGYPYPYGPPVCAYGYYPYYPYACAPYGYYGPDWFYGGVFIGAGPWFRGGYYGGYRGVYGYGDGPYRGGPPVYPRGYAGRFRGVYGGGARVSTGVGFHGGGGVAHFSGGHR